MGSVQQNPKLSAGEKVVDAIGKVIIAVIFVPIAKVWRLFKRK